MGYFSRPFVLKSPSWVGWLRAFHNALLRLAEFLGSRRSGNAKNGGRMRRVCFLLAAGMVFLGGAVLASDAWKDKPYQSWDKKDLQEILNNSPWGRPVTLSTADSETSMGNTPTGNTPTNSKTSGGVLLAKPGEDTQDAPTGGALQHGNGGASGDTGGDAPPSAGQVYIARWTSSRTIREAMARLEELNGRPIPDAAQRIAAVPDIYQVLIISSNLASFAHAGADALKDTVYLETKKSHAKIVPSKITLATGGPNDHQVRGVVIDFPRKTASGEATIASDEKEADLIAVAGKVKLKFHFELNKMADKQGADL
jgi:hypothetical protein